MMLIIDMPMPKDCPQCPMAHWNKLDEFTGCEVAAGKLFAVTRDKAYAESTSRPSWCPIKGVLPEEHGDLIDRDALLKHGMMYRDGIDEDGLIYVPLRDVMKSISNAPTVIAAERKDDEQD